MDIERYFAFARALEVDVPLVCMTYYNPVFRYGVEKFVENAAEAGISGLIIPDIPVEEAADLKTGCDAHGLDLIFLVAPTTTEARIRKILQRGGQVSSTLYQGSELREQETMLQVQQKNCCPE